MVEAATTGLQHPSILLMGGAQWTIKARVTNKAPKRSFSRDGASKSVFSIEVVDEQVPPLPAASASAAAAAAAAAASAHLRHGHPPRARQLFYEPSGSFMTLLVDVMFSDCCRCFAGHHH